MSVHRANRAVNSALLIAPFRHRDPVIIWRGVRAQTVREGDVGQHGSRAEGSRKLHAGDRSAQALARSVSAPPRPAAEAKRAGPPVPDLEDAGLVLDRASLFRPRGLAVRFCTELPLPLWWSVLWRLLRDL